MEFPQDVLDIISEYAKPVTCPEWRTCKTAESELVRIIYATVYHYMVHEQFYGMNDITEEWYKFNQLPGKLAWKA